MLASTAHSNFPGLLAHLNSQPPCHFCQAVVADERSYKFENFKEAVNVMNRTHQLTTDKQNRLQELTQLLHRVQGQVQREDQVHAAA